MLLNEFSIEGLNGRHLYIIYKATSTRIYDEGRNNLYPVKTTRIIVAQVPLGLDYIYTCRIVHAGKCY